MSESLTDDEKNLGMLAHLSALAGFVLGGLANFVGPLVIWQLKKDESDFVAYHGKEALNFQITCLVASILCGLLFFVLIGIFLLPIVLLANLILTIVAGLKARDGERYRYPFTIRLF